MDQGPLVMEQINAGAEFVNRFDQSVRVRAAFWLKESAESRWYLYIASDQINDTTITTAYAEVSRVARELANPHLGLFQVKLIGSDNPLAKAALTTHQRFAARVPLHVNGSQFGGVGIEGAYVYPPPPYRGN